MQIYHLWNVKKLSIFFLSSVLILGLIVNPSQFPNSFSTDNSNQSGFDFFSIESTSFAFAQEEVEEVEVEETEVEEVEVEETEAEEVEVEEVEVEEVEVEEKEIEIEIEIEDNNAEIKVKVEDEKLEFELDTTDLDIIVAEIIERTGLTREQIEEVMEVEIELEFEEEVEKLKKSGEKVRVCHVPPGNPSKAHTISINSAAIETHLSHGDFLGSCGDEIGSELTEREAKLAEKQAKREAKLAEKQFESMVNSDDFIKMIFSPGNKSIFSSTIKF